MVKKLLNSLAPETIMSIDASTNSLAFAIFENKELVRYGKISFEGHTTYKKVADACKKTQAFMQLFGKIDAIVIEHTVFMNSPKTASDLALVQGGLLGAAGLSGVNIFKSDCLMMIAHNTELEKKFERLYKKYPKISLEKINLIFTFVKDKKELVIKCVTPDEHCYDVNDVAFHDSIINYNYKNMKLKRKSKDSFILYSIEFIL
jgi:hypothetical protein